jgi:hypothetical protein
LCLWTFLQARSEREISVLKRRKRKTTKQKKNGLQIRDTYVKTLKEGIRRRKSRKEYIYRVVLRSVHYLSTLWHLNCKWQKQHNSKETSNKINQNNEISQEKQNCIITLKVTFKVKIIMKCKKRLRYWHFKSKLPCIILLMRVNDGEWVSQRANERANHAWLPCYYCLSAVPTSPINFWIQWRCLTRSRYIRIWWSRLFNILQPHGYKRTLIHKLRDLGNVRQSRSKLPYINHTTKRPPSTLRLEVGYMVPGIRDRANDVL